MSEQTPRRIARELFLRDDNHYGCAEAALVALQQAYDLPNADDSSAAMALNGGIAYSGGMCGTISGAAMAVGRLAQQRVDSHIEAKRTARRIIQQTMAEFDQQFGSHDCSTLTGYDLSTQEGHDGFIASGVWREGCVSQLEFMIAKLAKLADREEWDRVVTSLDS